MQSVPPESVALGTYRPELEALIQVLIQMLEEKPERITVVELKNGKVVFKQKPLSFEKMSETMQGMLRRAFGEDVITVMYRRNRQIQRNA